MINDQAVLQKAFDLVERLTQKPTKSFKIIRKLDQITDTPGLSDRSGVVIRYAIEKCKEDSAAFAWRILWDEMDRLEKPEEQPESQIK